MKKYLTLLSLITIFFVGMQHTQAQEKKSLDENQGKDKIAKMNEISNKEKEQSPEIKAKVAKLERADASAETKHQLMEIQEFITDLSPVQKNELHEILTDLHQSIDSYDNGDKDKKVAGSRNALIEESNARITKILSEEQLVLYKEYLAKVAKADK